MSVALKYGAGWLDLDLPPERVGCDARTLPQLGSPSRDALGADPLRAAFAASGSARWAAFFGGRRVGLLVADGTRSWAHQRVFPEVLAQARGARSLAVFVCTGTHGGESPETRALVADLEAALAASELAGRSTLWVHDAHARGLESYGATPGGTPLEVHPGIAACEALFIVADMKNHYFAGYSNAVKYLVPGLASFETARCNHALALDARARVGQHPWHPDPKRRDNPLAADMVAGFERIVAGREGAGRDKSRARASEARAAPAGIAHAALALTTDGGEVTWACADATRTATAAGIRVVDRAYSLSVAPARFAIVSAGGSPYDESLYTAQRALELCQTAVRPGGELLLLARCSNGIGPPQARTNFFEPLQRPLAELLVPPTEYRMYGHKPHRWAQAVARLERVWLTSGLDADAVRSIHMGPAPDPREIVKGWLAKADVDDRIHVIGEGSKIAVANP